VTPPCIVHWEVRALKFTFYEVIRMIRLAAFDIDRTLVSQITHTIAPETVEALRELQRRGIKTAIATGRQWQQVPKAVKALGFDYYILLNGTHIVDSRGNTLHREAISRENCEALITDIAEKDRTLYLRFEEGMYPVLARDREIPFGLKREEIPEELLEGLLMESPLETGALPMAALGQIPPEEEDGFRSRYPALDFLRVLGGKNCDINPTGISKATGLKAICGLFGIPMEDTIAFGDDINDLEIIRDAGIGVAMGDALEEVIAVADHVTDTCDNLGVVKGLKYFGLLD